VLIPGRVALVTGGASGLGLATVEMLVGAGARVVALDLDEDRGGAVARAHGDAVRFVRADVVDEDGVQGAVDAARQAFGRLDILVCAAGVAPAGRVLGRDGVHLLDRFRGAIEVNLTGTFNAVRLAAMAMAGNEPAADGERGVVVTTASAAAFDGQIGQAAYAASKGGVVAMTLPIARELAGVGIRVMTIAPGTFDTPLLANIRDEVRTSLAAQVPFPPRLGRPDEYAALVRHIIENQMLNGEVIRLDGALRMAPR
jgi:NAD(P)-dependent dehydrogenase (short-subunit alcohol dehydrogenase family)